MNLRHRYTNEMAQFNQWLTGGGMSAPLAYGVPRGDKANTFSLY